jgi:hypothetical protein
MRKITLDIEDSHFAAFEALARAQNADPLEIISTQLKQAASLLEMVKKAPGVWEHSSTDNMLKEISALNYLTAWATQTERLDVALSNLPVTEGNLEERRAARLAILKQGGPLWAGEEGKPKDGLFYEQQLRAEW